MIIFRKRLVYWLIKAYLKKWGKVLFLSFVLGLAVFFALLFFSKSFFQRISIEQKSRIGIAGAYKIDTLPPIILSKLSRGLTTIAENGTPLPDIAASWQTQNEGKVYSFTLKKNIYFSDGTLLTADAVTYPFSDVEIKRPNASTIIFTLKDQYSPFLTTVAKPLFKGSLVGVGEYKIDKIELNGSFIKSVRLKSTKNKFKIEEYIFYPTEEALKVGFALGEVRTVYGLTNDIFGKTSFHTFPNIQTDKKINYKQLVTLFYHTADPELSDKKLRNALSYSLPDNFAYGQRAFLPYSPESIYYKSDMEERKQDFAHAKELLGNSSTASDSAKVKLTIKTLSKYKQAAQEIVKAWSLVNIHAAIEEVDSIPSTFQLYLGDFSIPKDPDQYTLWHSKQINNITQFDNKRIDKLLEDGRKIVDIQQRQKIYFDFQKYLLDESPASFLYYPYEYNLTRK